MAVRIRLSRTGKKNQPSFRVVVADQRTKRDGRVIETLGFYNPLTDPTTVKIDRARFDYWLSVGAQPSDPVRRLILGQKRQRAKVKKEKTPEKKPEKKELTLPEEKTKKPTQATEAQKEPKEPEAREKS